MYDDHVGSSKDPEAVVFSVPSVMLMRALVTDGLLHWQIYRALRAAISDESLRPGTLARARGVVGDPEPLTVVHGSQQAFDPCARLFVDPGEPVAVEESHHTGFSFCLAAVGAEIVHVPVDEDSLGVEELEKIRSASLGCVTTGFDSARSANEESILESNAGAPSWMPTGSDSSWIAVAG